MLLINEGIFREKPFSSLSTLPIAGESHSPDSHSPDIKIQKPARMQVKYLHLG